MTNCESCNVSITVKPLLMLNNIETLRYQWYCEDCIAKQNTVLLNEDKEFNDLVSLVRGEFY